MTRLKGDLGQVEILVKDYKWDCLRFEARQMDLDRLSKYEPEKIEIIEKIKNNIDSLQKQNSNTKHCLESLNKNEYEFISEIYYNHKKYKDVIPLIRKILNFKANDNSTMIKGCLFKKKILNKLLKLNILGDAE